MGTRRPPTPGRSPSCRCTGQAPTFCLTLPNPVPGAAPPRQARPLRASKVTTCRDRSLHRRGRASPGAPAALHPSYLVDEEDLSAHVDAHASHSPDRSVHACEGVGVKLISLASGPQRPWPTAPSWRAPGQGMRPARGASEPELHGETPPGSRRLGSCSRATGLCPLAGPPASAALTLAARSAPWAPLAEPPPCRPRARR